MAQKLTVNERIRNRLLEELKLDKRIGDEQQLVDEILESTTKRMEEYLILITAEISKQRETLGTMTELRTQEEGLLHSRRETAMLGINLSDVFFRSDIQLLIKHLGMADEETIKKALLQDSSILSRLRTLIRQIDGEQTDER